MPTNTFNVGLDCTLVLIAPTGQRVDLSIVTDFEAKQDVQAVRVMPLNGPPLGADLPKGWTGSFGVDRASSSVDDLFSTIEQGFWATGLFGIGQIYQYVNEVDGSESTYVFNGVTMNLSDSGSWKADGAVKQKIAFFASTRDAV
jgi:hypothetical protein